MTNILLVMNFKLEQKISQTVKGALRDTFAREERHHATPLHVQQENFALMIK